MKESLRQISGLLTVLILAVSAFAQTNDEGLSLLQFSLSNPGARTVAMGGAFLGLADDATAAVANPAGLTILNRPELVVEFNAAQYTNQIPWKSGLQVFERQELESFDYRYSFSPADFSSVQQEISLASFVYPLVKDILVVSGFYDEPTNYHRDFHTDAFLRQECQKNSSNCTSQDPFFPTDSALDLSIKNVGASFGFKIHTKASVGVSLALSRLKISSTTKRLSLEDLAVRSTQMLNGEDNKLAVAIGLLLSPFRRLSMGAVYVKRPKFDVVATNEDQATIFGDQVSNQKFRIPDSVAAGVCWHPSDTLAVDFDVVRLFYSQLMNGYYNTFYHQAVLNQDPDASFFTADFQKTSLEVSDGTEIRVGGEYTVFIRKQPFALRLGYWREPFHSVVQTKDDADLVVVRDEQGNIINDTFSDPFTSRTLITQHNHITFGGGFVRDQLSLDLAFDFSKDSKRFVLTTFLYF